MEKEFRTLKEKLLQLAKNEIRILYTETEASLSETDSKIGGKPAVPADFIWPEYNGMGYCDDECEKRPLSFMAQINMEDIAEYDTENLLPKTGVLCFFYDLITMRWGFEPTDKGSARVYYFPDKTLLSTREFPENMEEDAYVPELKLGFEKHISLPYPDNFYSDDFDWDEYEACCRNLGYEQDGMGDVTKLLGYPDVIQNPMEEECETVTRGYSRGCPEDFKKIPEAEKEDITKKAGEWTLLFQMGTISTAETEIMFGDCGHIYFWIKRSDLEKKNFENVWLILQCC